MPISDNTRAVLEEMRKNGVDVAILAGLERELDSKPNADKGISDGVLAQPAFNSYKARKEQEILDLKNNLAQQSSLKSAIAGGLDDATKQAALERIAALEQVMIVNGFDLNDVREEVDRITSDPAAFKKLMEDKEAPIKKEELEVPNNPNGNYVDPKTFADVMQTGLTNVAVGGIHVQAEMMRAMREADKLGIDLTDEQLNTLGSIVVSGAEKGKKPYEAISEHLGFQTVRETKAKEALDAQLQAAKEEGRREALKDNGITITRRDKKLNPHPIFDRQKLNNGKVDSRIEKVEDLPKNEMGTPEYFRLRRYDRETRRAEHAANAADRYAEVSQQYDNEGMIIGNRQ